MNYSFYGFVLFFSTCILGSILFYVILILMEPIFIWYIVVMHFVIALNAIATAMTLWCVTKLKLTRTNGIFTPLIYTILSFITYICGAKWGLDINTKSIDFERVILATILSSFLSALLASFYLPKEEEQPKESKDNESDS